MDDTADTPSGSEAPQGVRPGNAAPRTGKKLVSTPPRIIVETSSDNYWATLRAVKEAVTSGPTPTVVEAARRNGYGQLVLDLAGDADIAATMDIVAGAVGTLRTRVANNGKVALEVKFLEQDTTEETILEAVNRALGGPSGISVVWVRDYSAALRIALIEGPADIMSRLLALKTVTVGWSRCPVAERLVRASQCWKCHGYGHSRTSCQGQDVSSHCRRCGEKGHLSDGCQADPVCLPCGRIGMGTNHFAGSGQCSAFRLAMNAGRRGERQQGR